MKLKATYNLTTLDNLKPLRRYKPLTNIKASILNIPSEIELILLSVNLLYQSEMIMNGSSKCKKEKCINDYIYKAMSIHKILDDYQNKYLDNKEFKQIKKEFGINGLYQRY
jgi:hypothetical protein